MKLSVRKFLDPHGFQVQVLATFLTQLGLLVLSIATAAIIARWLGPEGKGVLALALLIPGMLGLLLSGGIGVANVYFAGSRRLDVSTLTANSVAFAILATLLAIGAVGVVTATGWVQALVPGVPIQLVVVAMLGLPVALVSTYFSTILQGLQRIVTVNVVNLARGGVALALTMALVIGFRMGLLGAVLASLGAGAVGCIVLATVLRQHGGTLVPHWEPRVMRSTLSFGLRGHIGNVLQFFNYRADMFIVNYFLGPGAVGIYTVSVALAELLWRLPNAVAFVIFPKAAATPPARMNTFTPRIFRVTLALTTLGALGLALLGRPLIELIYSDRFINAYGPMLVLLPGVVLLGASKVLTNEIAGRGYPHFNSINAGLALVLTVVLCFLLLPRHGVLGAATASTVAYTANFLAAIGFYQNVSRGADVTVSGPSGIVGG